MKTTVLRLAIALLSFALFVTPAQAAFVAAPAATTTTSNTTTNTEAALKTAVTEGWKSMSRAERKSAIKSLKDALRGDRPTNDTTTLLLLTLLTIFVGFIGPAIAMFIHEGTFNNRVLISLILGLLGHIPGVIYNLIIFFGK